MCLKGKVMGITNDMIKSLYEFAKDVYNGKISIQGALNELSTKYSMNESSARYHINAYKCMRHGCEYKRAISKVATKYFLDNIYQNEGKSELEKALTSVLRHMEYNESFINGKLNGIRLIYEEYSKLLSKKVETKND